MKNPYLAGLLNFFFPGAGLWYLKQWSYGFINLAAFFGIELVIQAVSRNFYVNNRWTVVLFLALASAAIGFNVAKATNARHSRAA